jgi:hypothetical protein
VDDVGVDDARADGAEPDACGVEFGTKAVGEHVDRGLAGAIRVHRLQWRVGRHRRDVDDVSAGAALDETFGERPATVDDATEVDVEHPIPLIGRGVQECPGLPDSRVVDDDVGHPVCSADPLGEGFDGFGVGDVEHIGVHH